MARIKIGGAEVYQHKLAEIRDWLAEHEFDPLVPEIEWDEAEQSFYGCYRSTDLATLALLAFHWGVDGQEPFGRYAPNVITAGMVNG